MQTKLARWPKYYPNLEVEVFAPKFYYSIKQKRDEYSRNIINSKHQDLSDYFFEGIKNIFVEALPKPDLIAVIPSSKIGSYSPTMDMLAGKLSTHFGIKYSNVVQRIKEGKKMSSCPTYDERFNEIKGSFRVTQQFYNDEIVILDDTGTTGMTILECAKELKEAGALDTIAVCLGITE